MGCTESLPDQSAYDVPHKIDSTFQPIGSAFGAGPSTSQPAVFVVKEKLFSWSGDDFAIRQYPSGAPLGNNLKMKGKVFAMRDQMTLVDGAGNTVAVCLRKFQMIGQTFKVYVPNLVFPNQSPSAQKHNNQALYTYCEIRRVPMSMSQEVIMDGRSVPEYTITRAGGFWPKKRTVKKKGIPAALIEGGTWDTNYNSYKITCNPGIDPCLMACLSAICDEMDESK